MTAQKVDNNLLNPYFVESSEGIEGKIQHMALDNRLVPPRYDDVVMTYDGSGNLETATFKLETVTLWTVTLEYDGSNNLTRAYRS